MSLPARQRKKNAFGATAPPFIDYLKEILRRYPDGGQILKELIQNADDAGASQTVFIYDERRYGTQSVWSEALGKYQGPALYAFNDAAFTEEDWEGIQRAGRSIKLDDPSKVGRFGIGFNSIYHVTDLPCVFSSKHLAVFDPQKLMFDDEREGYRWSLDDEEDRKHLLEFTDQFKPFQDIVNLVCGGAWEKIISGHYFKGTLFRFPLRSQASEISDNLYDSKKMIQLFDSFIADAEISLLFLRTVSSISLMHIDIYGTVNIRIKVSTLSSSTALQECEVGGFQRELLEGKTSFKTVSCITPSKTETKTKWLVTTCRLMEGCVPEIDTLAEKLSFYPQVDVAFQCDEIHTSVTGRLSCLLPLPNNETNNTGLPVHINAIFGLTDNRRYIKWQEEDQKNDESARWNELLKKKVLPHVYLNIIQDAIQLSRKSMLPISAVYNLWPDLSRVEQKERWHEVALDVFEQLFKSKEVFSLAKNEKKWVAASQAVFTTNNTDNNMMAAVARLLIAEDKNFVTVPEHVLTAVKTASPQPATLQWVTPGFVRTVLYKSEIGNVCKDDKLSLLEYVLSDGKYKELQGLQLLPLCNGSFRSFTNEEEDTALIDSEEFPRVLLPFCKERFLPTNLNSNTIRHLKQMAMKNADMYKIINLDAKNVATFAKKHLPKDWNETQGHVKWNPAKDGHPPKTWLTEFWKFLNTHWEKLSEFIGMPLVPVEPLQKTGNTVLLARLKKNSTLIFQTGRESSLPDQVQKVVKIVGGTVIKKDECLKHYDLESYVLTTSPKHVLQILLNSNRDKVICGIASVSLHEKEEFKTYISSLDCISDAEKHLLSALPLFRLMSGKYVAIESKQAVMLKSNPAIPTDLPVPDTIVQCANEADRRLLTLLKVELLDSANLAIHLVDCIERKIFSKEEEQKIMTWILNHGNVLFSQSEELLKKSKNLSFIETEQGKRHLVSSLFDSTNKIFQDLFEEDFFPPLVYRTQTILQSLKQLGLRTKEEEISSTEILHVALQIQKLQVHSRNKAIKKANVLVQVLNKNDLLSKFADSEKNKLLQMQWVPCQNVSSINRSDTRSQMRGLYKPAEIRASKYSAIVGHVMPLTSDLKEPICQKLGLFMPPPAEKVMENLQVLGSIAPAMNNPDSDYEFKNKLHSTYKFMQENTEYFRKQMNNKCIAWLWCQNEFVSPQDVVLAYPSGLDLSLHIRKVPDEFLQYAVMLEEFGVKKMLSNEEIEDIFHDIKQSIDDRDPPYGEPSELKVSIDILDWMRKNKKPLKDTTPVPVRAPNQKFTLQPLNKTVYCDYSDEGLDDLRQDQEEFYVIHQEVLGLTAKWLKVPLLSTRILKPQYIKAEEVCPGIEQCGQTEPITQRIKNILKEYDEESDIFKELIQNAEDAKASTCGFLLDFRRHPAEKLIDNGMALCNGPCLWAFNNELFSVEDWKNIVRVGAASKENKIEKIGNFGLGFNAVYHLTDIPSILSGKQLLILDPNVSHLENHIHNKANPGIKLDLCQERLFRWFPGQFQSYQGIFDCDLTKSNQNSYNGTLIKLPFRTEEEASKSEISSKVYDTERIHAFQQQFSDDSQNPLLFLKNITSVSLQILSESASMPPLQKHIQTLLKISKEVIQSIDISNELNLQDIENTLENHYPKCQEIVNCFEAHIAEIVHEHVARTNTQYWFLYSCYGTKDSLRMFQREQCKCKFSLPIGGVAVPLQREDNVWSPDESAAVGQAFCFLPLPIKTGLPVQINGTFAVTSNRKALWESGTKLEWNKALLQDATASAYITTLLEMKKMAQNGNLQNYAYYTFWPNAEKVNKQFQPLVKAFYSAIAQYTNDKSLELFSNGQIWCSIEWAKFLDPIIEKNKTVGELAMKVFLNDTESSNCHIPLPSWVRNSFIYCGFHEMVMERTFHWVEFYQVVFKNLNNMDPYCRNTLIVHALDLNDSAVDELLKSTPCIPTQKVKKLQFINKLVDPHGKVACLYEPGEGRFLEGTENDYFTSKRIHRLLSLGMLSGSLTLVDIIERAETIPRVWAEDQKKAQKRLQCLFICMKENSHDVSSPHWETLKHMAFIPAHITDQDNNLITRLKKPSEVYSYTYYNLVNMTEFTVDHSKLFILSDDPVLARLGVSKNPPIETVLKQLKEAHGRSKTFEKSVLLNMTKSCYDYLNNYLINGGQPAAIIDHAQSIPFVFIEDHFVNVRSVAKTKEFEEKPYLYILPGIFSIYQNLWNCVGMTSQFTAEQFVAVLQKMSASSKPLSKSDLHVCISILTKGLFEAKDEKVKDCLLPDEKGVLTYSSKLNYNDTPWMPVQAGVKLCHKLIPRSVACHFGVVTTRHHTLQNHLVSGFSPFVQEFGQHEKLTVRLKNIMDAYPSKKDILKELIQNADDAEATEIHFVWDKRKHKTEKIFGEKWKLLQGPALCVYNNKTFSNEDLSGIQQLGEGGKQGTLGRTGKYGLGFNSVYHLTDCPSILTGDEYLCISDPNLKYVEGGTKESPGCMYLMDKKFKESFKDVYQTFLPEKFALESGTMIRLPLRTEDMAEQSEITRHVINDNDMREVLQALTEDSEGLILFLKHITKIQFHVVNTDGSQGNAFLIQKKVTESTQEEKRVFQNHVHNSVKSGQVIPCQAIYSMEISSGQKQSQWVIAERYGSILQSHEKDENLKVPHVALAACTRTKPAENKFTGRAFCSLPLPVETGLPVHVNGNFEVDFSRRDLWKEDAESLKTKWNESLQLNAIAPLYADLLNHFCAKLKKDKPQRIIVLQPKLDFLFKYFPFVSNNVAQVWHKMINEVYRSINQQNLPVIPTLRSVAEDADDHSHVKCPKYIINWSSVFRPDQTDVPHFVGDIHSHIFQELESTGMNLVPYSWTMEKAKMSFKKAGVDIVEVSPSSVIRYLKNKPLNNPLQTTDDLPLHISQTLIRDAESCAKLLKFCLTGVKESSSVDLNGLPLLLTKDQMLRRFNSASPKLISRYFNMFQGHESEFVDLVVNIEHTKLLQEGRYIEKLTIPVAAKFLKPVLQQLRQQSLPNQGNGLCTADKETISWLKKLWLFFDDQEKEDALSEKKNNTFNEIKKYFDDPILPVICPNQKDVQYLQSVNNLHSTVPDLGGHVFPISFILFKLGFVTLDETFFYGLMDFLLKFVKPQLLNIKDPNAVLEQLYRVPHLQFEQLSAADANEVQRYLQSGMFYSKNTNEYQRMFKSLPLFETVMGNRLRIDLHVNVFLLKTQFQERFPDLYIFDDHNVIFLKYSDVNRSLSESLNIKIMNDLDYCVKFMLSSIHKFKETQLLNLVKLLVELRQKGEYKDNQGTVVSTLKGIRFIKDINGHLQVASYFFDDKVHLYKVMLSNEKFVPEAFWKLFPNASNEAKHLLKDLGLKHEPSEQEIIDFALQIESDAKGNTDLHVLKQRSSTLFKTVLQKTHEKKSKSMDRIATIKFIFPVQIESKLCDYHKAFVQGRDVVAIKGSLLEKDPGHIALIWTAMPILPSKNCSVRDLDAMKCAGAFDKPPSEQVMQNLTNICKSPCGTEILINTRATVFSNSYAYLQSVSFDASVLAGLPLVLTENDTNLAKVSQVVLSIQDANDFRPYLYPIQGNHAVYKEFFKKIGVEDKPTLTQLCTVLKEIYSECCNKTTLQPNQITTVQRVVQQLFCQMKEEPKVINFQKNILYLPSTDGKLYESNTLFFNDTVFQPKRLEGPLKTKLNLLEKLKQCHLGDDHYEHQKLLEFIPKEIRPKLLSQVISENLGANVERCDYGKVCEFSERFEMQLSSHAFHHGFICLIREQSSGTVSQSEAAGICESLFGKIQIICCKSLETELSIHQETLEGTKTETQVYVKKQQDGCIFYLKHSDNNIFKIVNEVNMHLTKEINILLGNTLSAIYLPVLGQLLLCENMEDVERTLEKNGIHNSVSEEGGFGVHPSPGSPIPEEWYDALDMHPLNSFEKGEYVGFRKDESRAEYFFAIVVECLDEVPGQPRRNPQRYKIQVENDEFIKVSSLDLYQFKREKMSVPVQDSTHNEICILSGPVPSQNRPSPQTLEEVKREIDQCLNEIWNMSHEDKMKAIRRLYLKWHPDKNPDNPDLANEAFKYLKNRIEVLERGKTQPNNTSSWSNSSNFSNFGNFWSRWNDEAKSHQRGRQRFHQNYHRRQYNFWYHFKETPRPNKEEAKRWFKQAEFDLVAAQNETANDENPEWTLFKVHQALEKALIATEYRRTGKHPASCSITILAQKMSHYSSNLSDLHTAVDQLRALGVDAKRTQYPNFHPSPHIPHGQFKPEDAKKAVNIAREVLKKLEKYINE